MIVAADHSDGGFLAAVHRETGDVVWKKARPAESTYASPIVAHVAGKDQILIAGADQVASYDPATGEQFWSCEGVTSSCVGTVVWDDGNVFASGGYPGEETICIDASNGKPVWRNKQKVYISSLLAYDEFLSGRRVGRQEMAGSAGRKSQCLTGFARSAHLHSQRRRRRHGLQAVG